MKKRYYLFFSTNYFFLLLLLLHVLHFPYLFPDFKFHGIPVPRQPNPSNVIEILRLHIAALKSSPADQNIMENYFPDGATLKRKEGTVITVASHEFRHIRIISERFVDDAQERVAVFECRRVSDGSACCLKVLRPVCVPLFRPPCHFLMSVRLRIASPKNGSIFLIPQSDRPVIAEMARRYFRNEFLALENASNLPTLPPSTDRKSSVKMKMIRFLAGICMFWRCRGFPGACHRNSRSNSGRALNH